MGSIPLDKKTPLSTSETKLSPITSKNISFKCKFI